MSKTSPIRHRSIRLVPELRAVHIERYYVTTPATMFYFEENYDLAGAAIPAEITKIRMSSLVREFWSTTAVVLEIPEPLWMRFLPKGVMIAIAFKLTGAIRGRRRAIVTYAMENNTMRRLLGGRRNVPSTLVRASALAVGVYMRLLIDRVAYASTGASGLYMSLPFVPAIEHRTVEELPAPSVLEDGDVDDCSAVFVGVLENRKGVRELMRAWELVERTSRDARLTIIGPGPLFTEVQRWADSRPESRECLGQLPRDRVLGVLRRNTALVAPSVPFGRWREQIGLPIKEALSLGLSVVTTRQTGLAGWLEGHGHQVVAVSGPGSLADRLASALIDALESPLDRGKVRASLPSTDGRFESDAWLHGVAR